MAGHARYDGGMQAHQTWWARRGVAWRCHRPGMVALTFDDAPGEDDGPILSNRIGRAGRGRARAAQSAALQHELVDSGADGRDRVVGEVCVEERGHLGGWKGDARSIELL